MSMRYEPTAKALGARPTLRGVSHQVAFFAALAATVSLVVRARSRAEVRAVLIFGVSLAFLFGVSALYHRIQWSPVARQRMRRVDHAAIFVLIAGGYTPLFSLVPGSSGGHGALSAIWVGASLGVVTSIVWPSAPKWLTALLCVVLGWIVVGQVVDRIHAVGTVGMALLAGGGVTYSLGALVYALKKPDPWPLFFGYHEVFHALVILASVALYGHVLFVLDASSAEWPRPELSQ
jgi:hemolysin III